MRSQLLLAGFFLLGFSACDAPEAGTGGAAPGATVEAAGKPESVAQGSVYALGADSLSGESLDLSRYAGKVTVFVNVASKCGYTPQYEGLQALHEEFSAEDVAIVGIPSNDFGGQEPGSADEIAAFCEENYGVTFDMLAKTSTKEGASPLFDRFAELTGERPSWNFCKYVVSKDGTSARFFGSRTAPSSEELRGAIAELQAQ